MSELGLKSCRGTLDHVAGLLSCVIFNTPNMVRANFDLMYLRVFCASTSVSKMPIEIKLCVYPIMGSPIMGVLNTSPIAPEPFDLGRITFHLSKLGCSSRYLRLMNLYNRRFLISPKILTSCSHVFSSVKKSTVSKIEVVRRFSFP